MSDAAASDAGTDPVPATIEWAGDRVRLIDQRRLPGALVFVEACTVAELCTLIRDLAVRGAPAIGVAGAMGVALAAVRGEDLDAAVAALRATRPTAVNLAWALERVRAAPDPVAEAVALARADVETNRAIGRHGAPLLHDGARVLTHCNAGGLACVGYGTALGVIRAAHESGTRLAVWVGETRPVLQGARLTAWELDRLGIECTLVVDAAAASLMAVGEIDAVLVGADRIAADGAVANKIGTYALAVLAHHHGVAFHVAAPLSTVDPATADGDAIVIEERDADEVASIAGHRVAPAGVAARNPAFDVTPPALVSRYITEVGVFADAAGLLAARTAAAAEP